MRYQLYVIGAPSGDGEMYRQFAVPVTERDGRWVQAAPAVEHSADQFDIALTVEAYRDVGQHPCGPLEDIPATPPWRTVARAWLPDNFRFLTPEEEDAHGEEVARELRERGIID